MLTELVTKDFVAVNADAKNWEEAISCAGRLMWQNGCVESKYIDRMIETTRVMGPYNVIAPGIALVHARPEDGVNETCVSIVVLNESVVFGNPEHDPVKVVIGLAADSDNAHMEVIMRIANMLRDRNSFFSVCQCRHRSEVVSLVRSMLTRPLEKLVLA